jgi:hypothetical protein
VPGRGALRNAHDERSAVQGGEQPVGKCCGVGVRAQDAMVAQLLERAPYRSSPPCESAGQLRLRCNDRRLKRRDRCCFAATAPSLAGETGWSSTECSPSDALTGTLSPGLTAAAIALTDRLSGTLGMGLTVQTARC